MSVHDVCRCEGPVSTPNERLNVRPDGKIIEGFADYTEQ